MEPKMKKLMSLGLITGMLTSGCGPQDDVAQARKELPLSKEALTRASTLSAQDLFRGLFFGRGPVAAKLPQIWARGMPGAPKPGAAPDNTEVAKRLDVETDALAKSGISTHDQNALHSVSATISKDTLTSDALKKQVAIDTAAAAKAPVTDADISRVMSAIAKGDPTFFARFAKQIQSGDPVAVAAAIAETGVKLVESTAGSHKVTGAPLAKGGFASGLGSGLGVEEETYADFDFWLDVDVAVDVQLAVQLFVAVEVFLVAVIFAVSGDRDFGSTADPLRHETWMKLIAADLQG